MREEDLMRLLGGIGGVITLIETTLGFNERRIDYSNVVLIILSIILAVIVLLTVVCTTIPEPEAVCIILKDISRLLNTAETVYDILTPV